MLPHAILSLLVFQHGFIQIRFGIFEIFCFCFMSNKIFFDTIKFYTISFLCKHNFFIDEKRTQWMLGIKVKAFHESFSCFMKSPRNCISWNALKEEFQCILPIRIDWNFWYLLVHMRGCMCASASNWLLQ